MIKEFEYTVDERQYPVLVELKQTLDEEGDDIVTDIIILQGVHFDHRPYVKEDVLASIHELGIRLYDDFKFNF